jgi:1-acyl-sn-glycerol-3-phosphate acyltransferase
LLYHTVRLISRLLFRLLTRRRFEGRENIPRWGAVIFVSNHLNLMDAPLLWAGLGRKTYFMAKEELAEGEALAIFPEGMRSQSRKLKLAFPGAALIALRSGAPIIPIGISGTEKITGIAWLWRRPQMTVNIGEAFSLPPADGRLTKYQLAKTTDVIMERIAEVLPVEYRGHCQNNRRVNVVAG